MEGCIASDPIEDTESLDVARPSRWRSSCIASDPIEDTERAADMLSALSALAGCIASDPIEDTERRLSSLYSRLLMMLHRLRSD